FLRSSVPEVFECEVCEAGRGTHCLGCTLVVGTCVGPHLCAHTALSSTFDLMLDKRFQAAWECYVHGAYTCLSTTLPYHSTAEQILAIGFSVALEQCLAVGRVLIGSRSCTQGLRIIHMPRGLSAWRCPGTESERLSACKALCV